MVESQLFPLLMQIFEKLKSAVVVTLADLQEPGPTIVYANPAFLRQTGYPLEELVGHSVRILHGPRTDPGTRESLFETLRRGEEFEGTTWNYRKDGTAHRVRWYIRPLLDDHGEVSHYFAVQEDISLEAALVQDLLDRPELSVDGLALSSFVQILEMERRSCHLIVRREDRRGEMTFDRGRVVGAVLGDRTGAEAAFELLTWDRVDLELGPFVEAPSPPMDESLQHLLLESARLRDEEGREP